MKFAKTGGVSIGQGGGAGNEAGNGAGDRGGDSWAHYLDQDEALLWQGAPSGAVRLRGNDLMVVAVGGFFVLFSVVWIGLAVAIGPQSGAEAFFPLFGVPFLLIGLLVMVGGPRWNARVRRRTRYALTDRRAIVARSAWGRSLKSYPIDEDTRIDYRPGPEATIYFAEEVRRGNKGNSYTVRHGFEYIADGDAVYRLMRDIQRRAADRARG